MNTRMGTNIFISVNWAADYYREQGFTKEDVRNKVKKGEIEIMLASEFREKFPNKQFSLEQGRYFLWGV